MNKIKYIIIVLIILLIITLSILFYYIYNNKLKPILDVDEVGQGISMEVDNNLKLVTSRNDYYVVSACVNKFYQFLTNTPGINISNESSSKQAIYQMLDARYIEYKKIDENNIFSIISPINTSTILIDNMYVSAKDVNRSIYIVYGRIRNEATLEKQDFKMIVETDMLNKTFKVILGDYIDENITNIEIGKPLNLTCHLLYKDKCIIH